MSFGKFCFPIHDPGSILTETFLAGITSFHITILVKPLHFNTDPAAIRYAGWSKKAYFLTVLKE